MLHIQEADESTVCLTVGKVKHHKEAMLPNILWPAARGDNGHRKVSQGAHHSLIKNVFS